VTEQTEHVTAHVVARAEGIIAGLEALPDLISIFPGVLHFKSLTHDGTRVSPHQVLAHITGPRQHVLAAERPLLNLLGRMSGIATRTATFAAAIPAGLAAKLLDTRKTTPGLRVLEKYAVRCGGGLCHRIGLHDALLIKDNHIAGLSAGDLGPWVAAAATRARTLNPDLAFIEVEVDTLDQLESLLAHQRSAPPSEHINFILLDNMDPATLASAVQRRNALVPRILLEASGGVTLNTIAAIASSGVDRISVGGLTHSAIQLDVALDL
jgi:nicotinate-nucleotide pyrophosphorylase (carboxylating)